MRSNMITVVTAIASMLLVAQVAAADAVQDQLQLMEQRMAEMEDRLQATSDELQTAEATVNQQRSVLSTNGLIEDAGLRSGVGSFLDSVDISGVAAASYNHRLIESDINDDLVGGNNLFKNPDADTFSVDQIWMTIDKAPTEDSRAGFHVEYFSGKSAQAQNGGADDTVGLYSAYVSYLAPIGNGVQLDAGRLATPLGAEVVQTDGNFNITQGALFGLQPVTHTGAQISTALTDTIGFTFGIVNNVYGNDMTSNDADKAYYGQLQIDLGAANLNAGFITGEDNCAGGEADCETTVIDVVLSASPTESLDVWANFDYQIIDDEAGADGDSWGLSFAGRQALSDTTGVSARVEYVVRESGLSDLGANTDDTELLTITGTLDRALTDSLTARVELRYDELIEDGGVAFATTEEDQLVGIAQLVYSF